MRIMGAILSRLAKAAGKLLPSRIRRLRTLAWRVGHAGETAAANFLQNAGYDILCRNWRAPGRLGELDIVCRNDAGILCIVEVKTRRRRGSADHRVLMPIEAVDAAKRRHMRRATAALLREMGNPDIPTRYDVVEVWSNPAGRPMELRHWPNLPA